MCIEINTLMEMRHFNAARPVHCSFFCSVTSTPVPAADCFSFKDLMKPSNFYWSSLLLCKHLTSLVKRRRRRNVGKQIKQDANATAAATLPCYLGVCGCFHPFLIFMPVLPFQNDDQRYFLARRSSQPVTTRLFFGEVGLDTLALSFKFFSMHFYVMYSKSPAQKCQNQIRRRHQ